MIGSKRIEITSLPVRFWTVTRFPIFIVVYRPETKPLRIVTMLHGKEISRLCLRSRDSWVEFCSSRKTAMNGA
jgi:hypothetical protein